MLTSAIPSPRFIEYKPVREIKNDQGQSGQNATGQVQGGILRKFIVRSRPMGEAFC